MSASPQTQEAQREEDAIKVTIRNCRFVAVPIARPGDRAPQAEVFASEAAAQRWAELHVQRGMACVRIFRLHGATYPTHPGVEPRKPGPQGRAPEPKEHYRAPKLLSTRKLRGAG